MKNIKVLLILSLILITAYSYSIEVSASTKEQKIYDFADLLTLEEEEQLEQLRQKAAENLKEEK